MPEPRRDVEATAESSDRASSVNSTAIGDGAPGEKGPGAIGGVTEAAKLRNPLIGMSQAEVLADVDQFVTSRGLDEHREVFRQGSLLARQMNVQGAFEHMAEISEEDKAVLRREETHRWSQPFMLYFLCTLCAGSAIVQGMDQTAVNGAQVGPFPDWASYLVLRMLTDRLGILLQDF